MEPDREEDVFATPRHHENEYPYRDEDIYERDILDQNVEIDDEVQELPGNRKKKMKTRSEVWDHFVRIGERQAECPYCKHVLTCGGNSGTNHLKNHLKTCIPKPNFKSPKNEFVFDAELSRRYLALVCIKHKYPFSIGEHEYVQLWASSLNPNVKLPCRNTIRSDVVSIYEEEKLKAHDFFRNLKSKVSITTDAWTANITGRQFISLTAHYIDSSWNLQKRILALREMKPPHDGESLFVFLKELMVEWNLDKKLFSIVVDNATSNDSMVRKLLEWLRHGLLLSGELFHVRCSAHILNLVVQDGLAVVRDLLEKIRESVKYLKRSGIGRQRFETAKIGCGCEGAREVAQDVPNRWNSTYSMLETAIPLREAFERLAILDKGYTHNPSKDEWDVAEKVCQCLKPFYLATRYFSGSKYPTSNVFFPEICKIHLELLKWKKSDYGFMRDMCEPMLKKFVKYWECCSLTLAIAVVLDPRFKMHGVEYYYSKIYGRDGSSHVERVRARLTDLYVTYGGLVSEPDLVATSASYDAEFDSWCGTTSVRDESELDTYLKEPKFASGAEINVLEWWKSNSGRLATLSKIARDLLAVPVTTVASEAAFSISGRVISESRNRIESDAVEAIVVADDWITFVPKNPSLSSNFGSVETVEDGNDANMEDGTIDFSRL